MEVNQYRLPENLKLCPLPYKGKTIHKLKPFLRGPIPLDWLKEAMKLKGASLSVGVILWYLGGLKKSASFKVGIQDLASLMNQSRQTVRRALSKLEGAKLISIERRSGRKLFITIMDSK